VAVGLLSAEADSMTDITNRGWQPRTGLQGCSFVVTDYRQFLALCEAQRRFPSFGPCPYHEDDPSKPCDIRFHHLRDRKTGAVSEIVVLYCVTHDHAFGVYPHGAVPYSRERWCPVAPSGAPLRVVEDAPPVAATRELSALETAFVPTYPGASVDESRGVLWPTGASWQDEPGSTVPRRETQIRRSRRALQVLGIDSENLADDERRNICRLLQIPMTTLRELEAEVLSSGRKEITRARGQAVCTALEAMPALTPTCLAHHLAMAGYLAGIWGRPWVLDVDRGTMTSEPFRRGGRGVVTM